jgi:type I restriction enzyme S subunit
MRSDPPRPTVAELQADGVLLVEDGNHGEYRPRSDEFVDHGVAFIRAADMDGGRVLFEKAERINDVARTRIRKGIGRPGDVLLSHKGTVGKVSLVSDDAPPFVCSPQTTFWRTLDTSRLDRLYLYSYLRSPEFRAQLASRKGETDMADYVSLTAQRQLRVALPPVSVQLEIGATIGALDARMNLLRQTNATLESIVRALFKSWFIDFDPVRAKAEGREPEGMDAATAALFPGETEESELGEVPRGWLVKPIGDLVDAVGGSTPDTKAEDYWNPPLHHWTSPKDLSGATAPVLLDTERKVSDAGLSRISSALLPPGTLLMSSRAPIGYLSLSQIPVAINQGYIAMRPGGVLPPLYLYFWCQAHMETIKARANGSTFMEISKKAFRPIPALVPPPEVVQAFVDVAAGVFARLTENERQARSLTQVRDALLPRLISGKLRLPEAQEQVEAALE